MKRGQVLAALAAALVVAGASLLALRAGVPGPGTPAAPPAGSRADAPPGPAPARADVWRPRPGTSWEWQIADVVDPGRPVQMYDIDLFDAQEAASRYSVPGFGTVEVPKGRNAGIITRLHGAGKIAVCYIDTGSWEEYRPDARLFPRSVLGDKSYAANGMEWKGERYLDIRRSSWPKFEPVIAARFDLARRSGCDGIEGDQNNSAAARPGFPITLADQKAWYLEIARLTHERGMSAGMKNGLDTTDGDAVAAFDWNLNEECNLYSECEVLKQFIAAGKAVFQVEYVENGSTVKSFCPADNAANFDGLLAHLALNGPTQRCR